jgi:V8-like Glu-specific endopeptidase
MRRFAPLAFAAAAIFAPPGHAFDAGLDRIRPPAELTAIGQPEALQPQSLLQRVTVFHNDSRQELKDRSSPWGAIGKLTGPSGSCTASLVGPDLLLTAAHCVLRSGNRDLNVRFDSSNLVKGNYVFQAGYSRGTYLASAGVTYFQVGTFNNWDNANDWAILRLDRPIGHRVGWLGGAARTPDDLISISNQEVIYMVSYPGDLNNGQVPYWEKNCRFKFKEGNLPYQNCNTSSGASGAPMFIFERDKGGRMITRVVAVNSAERRYGAKRSVIGVHYSASYANNAAPSARWQAILARIRSGDKTR